MEVETQSTDVNDGFATFEAEAPATSFDPHLLEVSIKNGKASTYCYVLITELPNHYIDIAKATTKNGLG